jgi:hypothetical protein
MILLRRDEQQFHVGVTSHMSNVVFDKHVVFCEEYMAEVRETVTTFFETTPMRKPSFTRTDCTGFVATMRLG